jgi:simple sugar transport system substrate-binding protein
MNTIQYKFRRRQKMKTHKLYLLIVALLVLGLVLTACQPPATEAPEVVEETEEMAEEPTEAMEEPAEVVEEPTEVAEEPTEVAEEPAETEGPAPAADGGWCAGTKIHFYPGGSPGGPFATVVYNGAVAAAADLGADVEYIWSDWNPEQMVTQLSESIAIEPDGIAIMGHPGVEAYAPLVDDAEAKGIIVTAQNVELPELQEKYLTNGFGYVGQVLYTAGYNLGAESVKRFGLGEGDKAMVWGLLAQAGRGERTQGIIDALEEAGMVVEYLEIDDATNADAAAGTPTFVGYMSANPDTKLIVTDHGALTATQETYLTSAGLGPDDVFASGFDLSSSTVEAIRSGWTDLVIDQQQWLQGYLPILQICLTHNYLFNGLHIDTGAGFAHADNVELLAELVEKQIR